MQLELHEHVGEGSNKRIWRFKGLVIKVKKPNHADGTFTIRGKVAGHTIEKIYPLSFPSFDKVLLSDKFKVKRAKLYYMRDKVGKSARMKTLLTNEDKGVDLLKLAQEEIEALQKAYEEANKKEEKKDKEEVKEEKKDDKKDDKKDQPAKEEKPVEKKEEKKEGKDTDKEEKKEEKADEKKDDNESDDKEDKKKEDKGDEKADEKNEKKNDDKDDDKDKKSDDA